MRKFFVFATAVVVLVTTISSAASAETDTGRESGKPTAIVTIGDSYISGEAGRWEGNYPSSWSDRGGTDRAAYRNSRGWWRYDRSRVYGDTVSSGCHRSDVAPALSNTIPVDSKFNLACSGAATANVFRAGNGGTSHRGEAPQADQLAAVAATHDIEMIVVSIGGNDLGFTDIIIDCTVRYVTSPWWKRNTCNEGQQRNLDRNMGRTMDGVGKAIDEIRAVMDGAGQPAGSYRLVLQSYPSPISRGADFRYRETGWDRTIKGGCPFWNVDADWARDQMVPAIAGNLAAVAAAKGVEFLDLQDQLNGREVCANSTAHGLGPNAEWGRFLVTGITQGDAKESMHPNALGQRATGTCLSLLFSSAPGNYRCTNVAGQGPDTMNLAAR